MAPSDVSRGDGISKPSERSVAPKRCYRIADICEALRISRRTFSAQRAAGKLFMLDELLPRIGQPRFRAEPIDRWLNGCWGQPRAFASARRLGTR